MTVTAPRQATPGSQNVQRRYLRPVRPIYFPSEEEVPETRRHLDQRTALYVAVRDSFGEHAAVGSEQFVYWNPTDPAECCAPDLFVCLGQPDARFDVWKVWERGAPDLALEIISGSDAADRPWDIKLCRYRRAGVRELVRFDPENEALPLRIWDLLEGDLVERDPADPLFRKCDALDRFWCFRREETTDLSLFLARDPTGADPCISKEESRRKEEEARSEKERTKRRHAESRRREEETRRREEETRRRQAEVKLCETTAELDEANAGRRQAEAAREQAEARLRKAEEERQAAEQRLRELEARLSREQRR